MLYGMFYCSDEHLCDEIFFYKRLGIQDAAKVLRQSLYRARTKVHFFRLVAEIFCIISILLLCRAFAAPCMKMLTYSW